MIETYQISFIPMNDKFPIGKYYIRRKEFKSKEEEKEFLDFLLLSIDSFRQDYCIKNKIKESEELLFPRLEKVNLI